MTSEHSAAKSQFTADSTPLPDTQARIVSAALACVKRWGVEKVTLNDIAREAGVTRPTVYSYFKTRDDVIRFALLQSAFGFAQKLFQHINGFHSPEGRFLESFLFALKHLPEEPYLELVTDAGLSSILKQHALNAPDGLQIARQLVQHIFLGQELAADDLNEITEIAMRLLLSLLMVEGPTSRTDEEMRDFLRRRLLPAVGLGLS